MVYFELDVLAIFLRIYGYNSGFAVENPQNSVCQDWLSAHPKIATAPHSHLSFAYKMPVPGAHLG